MTGRVKTYEAIVKGSNIPTPGVPESFKVLVKELQALCLDIRVLDEAGNEIELKEDDDDEDIVYAEHHIQPMGGVSEESLPEGFGIDEDSPEGIYEDVADDSDAYDEE